MAGSPRFSYEEMYGRFAEIGRNNEVTVLTG